MALNPAQPYTETSYPFHSRGMVTRLDAAVLSEIQYLRLINLVCIQEGTLRSRNGYENLTPSGITGATGTLDTIHSLARLATGSATDAGNYLYYGHDEYVYRVAASAPATVIPSEDTATVYAAKLYTPETRRRWTGVPYKKYTSGTPYLYVASAGRMLKDPLTDVDPASGFNYIHMQRWGIDRPVWPAQAQAGAAGNLTSAVSPYSYCYTLRNPITGHESNPSPLMWYSTDGGTTKWVTVTNQQINVVVRSLSPDPDYNLYDHQDPQADGNRNIVLYRQGGSFNDGLYRRVAVLTGGGPSDDTNFIDDVPDAEIAGNPTVDFDNDRPVTANLPTPVFGQVTGTPTVITAGLYGISGLVEFDFTMDQGMPPGVSDISEILFPGTLIRMGSGTDREEFCVIQGIVAATGPTYRLRTVWQWNHPAGEYFETSTRANQPCPFACSAFNCLFLAGDAYNRNILYKSKPGRPEAFPATINFADGSPGSIEVGTPSDPIMNIAEFDGKVLCLNKAHLYIVQLYNGYMQAPVQTLAQRGLFASWAWCKADNEIWYLAYDGIYSWSGGQSQKRSEAIDHIFKGEFLNGFYPISLNTDGSSDPAGLSDLDKIQFGYYQNEIYVYYVDTNGARHRLRYHTVYDRWSIEDVTADATLLEEDSGRALFVNAPLGVALVNQDNIPGEALAPATTDGCSAAKDDGAPIAWEAWTGWYTMGLPTMQKQFGDVVLELVNEETEVTVQVYYDFSGSPTETFTIPAAPGETRHRYVMALQAAAAQEAYAVSMRFVGSSIQPVALHSLTFHYLTLEQIQHGRASDWDNLGYPYDKRLSQLSLEYDVAGTNATVYLDIMNGITGETLTQAVQTFTFSSPASTTATGPLRARTTFPINDGIVAKMVRLRPAETSHNIKIWDYHFDFIQYPPDKVLFTEWDALGYPCEKVLREVVIEVDTGGIAADVNVQVDGSTKRTFQIQTTMDSRHQIVTLNQPADPELLGKQFRLLNAPGVGGKFQLFGKPTFTAVREPCIVNFWDSLEQTFAYNGFKFMKQFWVQYRSCVPLLLRLYVDGKLLLLEEELPQHDRRELERIYVPVATGTILNKSKTYRLTLESMDPCCGFHMFAEATRAEWMPVGADMRTGYQQAPWSEVMERVAMP